MKKNIKPIALIIAAGMLVSASACDFKESEENDSRLESTSENVSEVIFESNDEEDSAEAVVGIVNAEINDKGELVLTYTDGRQQNLGVVVGRDGEDGKDGEDGSDGSDGENGESAVAVGIDSAVINERGELILKYTNNTEQNLGVVVGKDGADGQNGIGVSVNSATINAAGELILSYSNGKTQNLGVVVGKDGENGEKGDKGDKGDKGEIGSYVDYTQNIEITVNRSETDATEVAAKALPSAVSIVCKIDNNATAPEYSSGSGLIYRLDKQSGDAFIITNHHVVYSTQNTSDNKICTEISVYLYGGEYIECGIPATYVGGSMNYDIAVLRVEDSEILKTSAATAVTISDSDKVTVGESAIAIGNAEGMGMSVTSGIVCVDSETVDMLGADERTEVSMRFMRIDSAVNHGNSGGGLFNTNGELLGIVSAKLIDESIEGIGYAIPINLAVNVADNIIDNCWQKDCEAVQRAIFGVSLVPVNTRVEYNTEEGRVVLSEDVVVYSVTEGGPSYGKVKVGDIMKSVTLNGETVIPTRVHHAIDFLLKARVGDSVVFTFVGEDGEHEVTINITQDMIVVG